MNWRELSLSPVPAQPCSQHPLYVGCRRQKLVLAEEKDVAMGRLFTCGVQ